MSSYDKYLSQFSENVSISNVDGTTYEAEDIQSALDFLLSTLTTYLQTKNTAIFDTNGDLVLSQSIDAEISRIILGYNNTITTSTQLKTIVNELSSFFETYLVPIIVNFNNNRYITNKLNYTSLIYLLQEMDKELSEIYDSSPFLSLKEQIENDNEELEETYSKKIKSILTTITALQKSLYNIQVEGIGTIKESIESGLDTYNKIKLAESLTKSDILLDNAITYTTEINDNNETDGVLEIHLNGINSIGYEDAISAIEENSSLVLAYANFNISAPITYSDFCNNASSRKISVNANETSGVYTHSDDGNPVITIPDAIDASKYYTNQIMIHISKWCAYDSTTNNSTVEFEIPYDITKTFSENVSNAVKNGYEIILGTKQIPPDSLTIEPEISESMSYSYNAGLEFPSALGEDIKNNKYYTVSATITTINNNTKQEQSILPATVNQTYYNTTQLNTIKETIQTYIDENNGTAVITNTSSTNLNDLSKTILLKYSYDSNNTQSETDLSNAGTYTDVQRFIYVPLIKDQKGEPYINIDEDQIIQEITQEGGGKAFTANDYLETDGTVLKPFAILASKELSVGKLLQSNFLVDNISYYAYLVFPDTKISSGIEYIYSYPFNDNLTYYDICTLTITPLEATFQLPDKSVEYKSGSNSISIKYTTTEISNFLLEALSNFDPEIKCSLSYNGGDLTVAGITNFSASSESSQTITLPDTKLYQLIYAIFTSGKCTFSDVVHSDGIKWKDDAEELSNYNNFGIRKNKITIDKSFINTYTIEKVHPFNIALVNNSTITYTLNDDATDDSKATINLSYDFSSTGTNTDKYAIYYDFDDNFIAPTITISPPTEVVSDE